MEETTKKKFKMPNSFTILFILTAIVAVLTWIIPAGQYDLDDAGNFIQGTRALGLICCPCLRDVR